MSCIPFLGPLLSVLQKQRRDQETGELRGKLILLRVQTNADNLAHADQYQSLDANVIAVFWEWSFGQKCFRSCTPTYTAVYC